MDAHLPSLTIPSTVSSPAGSPSNGGSGNGSPLSALEEETKRWSPRGIMALTLMCPLAVGPGTAHDPTQKTKVLKVAAGRSNGESSGKAWLNLGRAHHLGEGTKVDLREALHCFEEAATRGEADAAFEAGKLLFEGGPGFRPNHEKAQTFFEQAAASGHVPEADRRLGELFVSRGDFDRALSYFEEAFALDPIVNASAGVSAARLLSMAPEPDTQQAMRLLKRAANVGNLGCAQVRLAVMHELGIGGAPRDPAEARKYWKLAVVSDVAEAHYRCGVLELHGAGFVQSERAAVNSFRRAIKLGFPLAAQRLGGLRGARAVEMVEARRVKQADFLDSKYYAAALYPWPFYDDEVRVFEIEEAEREVREQAAQVASKKAKIEALAAGKGSSAANAAAEAAAKEARGEVIVHQEPWEFPDALRQCLDEERAQLMQSLDSFEQHLPKRVGHAPPPPPDRVRDFFNAAGFRGKGLGQLAAIPVHDAVVALNGEGQEGHAYSRGAEGYRNVVFDQQGLDKKLGAVARTAKPLTTRPKQSTTRGHANLEGYELKVYTAGAPADPRFRSTAKADDHVLASAKRRAAARRRRDERDTEAIVHIARDGPPPEPEPGRTRQGTARSHKSDSQKKKGNSSHDGGGGGGGGATTARSGSSSGYGVGSKKSTKQGPSSSSRSRSGHGNPLAAQLLGQADEPPSWMYNSVWMEKPLANGALARAVELRRNYGTAPRMGSSSAAQSRRVARI